MLQVLGAWREDGDPREGDRQVLGSPGAGPEAGSDQQARDWAPREGDGQARLTKQDEVRALFFVDAEVLVSSVKKQTLKVGSESADACGRRIVSLFIVDAAYWAREIIKARYYSLDWISLPCH